MLGGSCYPFDDSTKNKKPTGSLLSVPQDGWKLSSPSRNSLRNAKSKAEIMKGVLTTRVKSDSPVGNGKRVEGLADYNASESRTVSGCTKASVRRENKPTKPNRVK